MKLKTPISYYGGKQQLLKEILPRIPEHTIYTETFFGGGAVFFAKEPVPSEIINDVNSMVITFYEVVQTDFKRLKTKINATLHSRTTYKVALCIYQVPHLFDRIHQAWAFYVGTNMGFSKIIQNWGYSKCNSIPKSFSNKKLRFNQDIAKRLEGVQIENNDACKVIMSRDSSETFHYVDPPYINSNQGHYGGYTHEDYKRLLETLSNIKGKFLLSSYPSDVLQEYTKVQNWHTVTINKTVSAGGIPHSKRKRKQKIEVLTANYPI